MDQPQVVPQVQNQKSDPPRSTRSLWWLLVVVVVALGLGVWSWLGRGNANANTNANANAANTNVTTQNTNAAVTYMYPGQDGKLAIDLLKAAYPNTTTKISDSLGEYVTGINGREAGRNEYWQFLVDGKEAPVGAGSYTTKSSETITWQLVSF